MLKGYACRKCGSVNLAIQQNAKNSNATDLYCADCGAWQKFATKDEIRALSNNANKAQEKYVEVVRCKECKWQYDTGCPSWYEENGTCRDMWAIDQETGFCSEGERKEQG